MIKAVLLLSGGLDSAANLVLGTGRPADRGDDYFEVEMALTVDYGQRGAKLEIEKAAALARHFGVDHQAFDLRSFAKLVSGRSALLGQTDVPVPGSLDDLGVARKSAAAVWVPNRNGVLISLAAALAESRGYGAVAVGFNAEEAVTFPDNTTEYMTAMTGSLSFSTANHVKIVSATATLTKREIVARLAERQFPFGLLWSCYHARNRHCGRCESCQRLHRAIDQGIDNTDLKYRIFSALFAEEAKG